MTDEPADDPTSVQFLGDASFIIAILAPALTIMAFPCTQIAPEAYQRPVMGAVSYAVPAVAVVLGAIALRRKVSAMACGGIAIGTCWLVVLGLITWLAD